jgi:AcrR family transcriptional regulator
MPSSKKTGSQHKSEEPSRRERILDAAEALFAEHGYDGVTLRRIATAADVDVALANYHFGKKLELFEAVFERRAALLNGARREALHACQASSGKRGPSVEQIIEAFLRPARTRAGNRRRGLAPLSGADRLHQQLTGLGSADDVAAVRRSG